MAFLMKGETEMVFLRKNSLGVSGAARTGGGVGGGTRMRTSRRWRRRS